MGYRGFNSFDEVAKKYAETVPIRGARKAQDIRPLVERRYWWQRVIKINDNKYVLSDGNWTWSHWANGSGADYQLAPITWERRDDGDYLIVRNCPQDSYSVTRYGFLDRFLPRDMSFWFENGKHFVRYKGKDIYLAKPTYEADYNAKTVTILEDNKLEFKCVDGEFVRVGKLMPFKTRHIDKDLTTKYRPMVKEFWNWAQAVLPVMGNLYDIRGEYAEKLTGTGHWYWDKRIKPQHVRDILENPEHEDRIAFALLCAVNVGATGNNGLFEPNAESWANFRKLVDRLADMYLVEMR